MCNETCRILFEAILQHSLGGTKKNYNFSVMAGGYRLELEPRTSQMRVWQSFCQEARCWNLNSYQKLGQKSYL